MIERQPDFEDDKIRAWMFGPKDRKPEKSKGDPTMLSVDVEREEIFESRIYRFQASPEVLLYLIDHVMSRQPELEIPQEDVIPFARELMQDTAFKFLAKRRKEDGLVSSLLVAVSSDDRSLLSRQEWVEEGEYRQAVQEFETSFLPAGVLTAPLVTTLEEWRRYSQEGPFSRSYPIRRDSDDPVTYDDQTGGADNADPMAALVVS